MILMRVSVVNLWFFSAENVEFTHFKLFKFVFFFVLSDFLNRVCIFIVRVGFV